MKKKTVPPVDFQQEYYQRKLKFRERLKEWALATLFVTVACPVLMAVVAGIVGGCCYILGIKP